VRRCEGQRQTVNQAAQGERDREGETQRARLGEFQQKSLLSVSVDANANKGRILGDRCQR